jgi:hypothetical protein
MLIGQPERGNRDELRGTSPLPKKRPLRGSIRLFSTSRDAWLRGAVGFGVVFGILAWSFTTLPVTANYRMTSVRSFLVLESAFTVVQFAIVSPLIAWAWRDAP